MPKPIFAERIATYSPDGRDTHQGVCFCPRGGVVGSNLCNSIDFKVNNDSQKGLQ